MGRVRQAQREVPAGIEKGEPVQVNIREMGKGRYKRIEKLVDIADGLRRSQDSTKCIEQAKKNWHLNQEREAVAKQRVHAILFVESLRGLGLRPLVFRETLLDFR